MALHYQNPNYLINQQPIFPPFEPLNFHFQHSNDLFIPPPSPLQTELLSFDNPLPPTLFHFDDPSFHPVPLQPFDHFDHDHHDFIIPNTSPFEYVDFPPPMLLPYGEDYHTQFTPFPKKQKIEFPEINNPPEFIQDFRFDDGVLMQEDHQFNPFITNQHFDICNGDFNEGYGDNINYDNKVKVKGKVITAQSRAARERRRKITMKTHELGKLIPGGTKMNTAEMFQAASKYVKFMQAQLGVLQSINALHNKDDCEKEANLNNLPILSSQLVQEKLFAKEKCLVPLDFLPVLEAHCDMETKPSISQYIKELLH